MPTLRNLRVINAHFNYGKNVYQDFLMPFDGLSTTYQLRNGGGKTVLMLLLLQCILPGKHFSKDKPLKNIFLDSGSNETLHVLAEWKLDEGYYDYKYLLTGFCARKKKSSNDDDLTISVDSFNYIHLYNDANEYDIHNIPLCHHEDGEFITTNYDETRSLLKELEVDWDIWTTNKKYEYQQEIKRYNLLESEWERMRKINGNENHLMDFFKRYKDSRRVVEDLLLPVISECLEDKHKMRHISDSFVSSSESLAEALHKSLKKLKELREESEQLHNYEGLLSETNKIISANEHLIESFQRHDESLRDATSQLKSYEHAIQVKMTIVDELNQQKQVLEKEIKDTELKIEHLKVLRMNVAVNQKNQEYERIKDDVEKANKKLQDLQYNLNFVRAVELYFKLRKLEKLIQSDEILLKNANKDEVEILNNLNPLGKALYLHYSSEQDRISHVLEQVIEDSKKIDQKIKEGYGIRGSKVNELESNKNTQSTLKEEIEKLEIEIKDLNEILDSYPRISTGYFVDKVQEKEQIEGRLADIDGECQNIIEKNSEIGQKLLEAQIEKARLETFVSDKAEEIEGLKLTLTDFDNFKNDVLDIVTARENDNIDSCLESVHAELHELETTQREEQGVLEELNWKIDTVEKYGFVPNKDFEKALEKLHDRFLFAKGGGEYLKEKNPEERNELLEKARWLTKAILLAEDDFNGVVANPDKLPASVMDSSVILANIESLRKDIPITTGDIFIPARNAEHISKIIDKEKTLEILNKKLTKTESKIQSMEESLQKVQEEHKVLYDFTIKYSKDYEAQERNILAKLETDISEGNESLKLKITEETQLKEVIENNDRSSEELAKEKKELESRLELYNELLNKEENFKIKTNQENKIASLINDLEREIKQINNDLLELDISIERQKEQERSLGETKREYKSCVEKFQEYNIESIAVITNRDISEILAEFNAFEDRLKNLFGDLNRIKQDVKNNKDICNSYRQTIIETYCISLSDIESKELTHPFSEEHCNSLKMRVSAAEEKVKLEEEERASVEKETIELKSYFDRMVEAYNEKADVQYSLIFDMDDEAISENLEKKCIEEKNLNNKFSIVDKDYLSEEQNLSELKSKFNSLDYLAGLYDFRDGDAPLSDELKSIKQIETSLNTVKSQVDLRIRKFDQIRNNFLDNVKSLAVEPLYITQIERRLRVGKSLEESLNINNELQKYITDIEGRISTHQIKIDGLEMVREKIINLALDEGIKYKDFLYRFSKFSKIRVNNRNVDMVRINLQQCEYTNERAHSEMEEYIQELSERIEKGDITQNELVDHFNPKALLNRLFDMSRIKVEIRKIDEDSLDYQIWGKVMASDGQESAMYIVVMVVLMSFIRNIVVGREDEKTSKVLLIDNPFGATGSCYLWDKIWSILEENNVQIICPGHEIPSKIIGTFPVNHVLSLERTKDGRRKRVMIKVGSKDEVKDRINQCLWGGRQTLFDASS